MTNALINVYNRGETSCCDPWKAASVPVRNPVVENEKAVFDDTDLAREMNELSVEERERVYEDIHGVAKAHEEKPQFIKKCIRALDSCMGKIPAAQRKNYNRALLLCPKIKTDTELKLKFLRADVYDPEKAAHRIVKMYDEKCALFGEEKLVKRITIHDLNDDDIYFLRSGFQILLPFKDQSGRPLIFFDTTKLNPDELPEKNINLLRGYWYLIMSAVEDVGAQKSGACLITYYSGADLFMPGVLQKVSEAAKRRAYMATCLPCRYTSITTCYNDPRMKFLLGTLRLALGKPARLRMRAHLGSDLEHDYFLMTVGVPCKCLIQKAGYGNMAFHEEYIQRRLEIDTRLDIFQAQEEARSGHVCYPSSNDVLIGRGVPYQSFAGNVRWNDLIYANLERYAESKQFEKTCISMEMVKTVHEYQGRFLQRTGDGWMVLDDATSREKAASAFRTRLRPTAAGASKSATQIRNR